MKTILVPARNRTGFVNLFQLAANLFRDEKIHFILLEIRQVPDNLNDLLTLGRTANSPSVFDQSLVEDLGTLQRIPGLRISFNMDEIYGDAPAMFRNYTEHHRCDLVIYDKEQWQNSKKQYSLDVFRMLSRSGCELMYVSGDNRLLPQHIPLASRKADHKAPASIVYQYKAVEEQLNYRATTIVSRKFNNLSRYFLSEDLLQKMLRQSDASLLLLKK